MPSKCSVVGCSSTRNSHLPNLTFHRLPRKENRKRLWLEAIGMKNLRKSTKDVHICSVHFDESSFNRTLDVIRLRDDAVPSVLKTEDTSDTEEPPGVEACRMCLASDVRLVSLRQCALEEAILNLIGTNIQDDRLPSSVCIECATRLRSYLALREKTIRAQRLMFDVLGKGDWLTKKSIATIDRETNRLTSQLTTVHLQPETQIQIEYEERMSLHEVDIDVEAVVDEIKSEIENEDDIFGETNLGAEASDSSYDIPIKDLKRAKVKKKKRVKKKSVPIEPKIDRRRKPLLNPDLNETLFTVTELSIDEQLAEINKRQESSNFKNSLYKCMECFKGFLDEEAFNTHMVRHTDQCGDYKCDICKTNFKNRNALRKHITAHHTQRFNCNSCDYVTTHRQTARLHERWHKGTKYQCPHCLDVFFKFTTYMGHIRIKHPSDFVCALCGYSFVSLKGIELHKKLKHRLQDVPIPDDGPRCEECSVTFISPEAYRRHLQISRRHSEADGAEKIQNKPRKLRAAEDKSSREMDKSAEDKKTYPSQIRKAEGPIPCEQCGLQLEDSRAYHGHFRRAHPDKNRTNYPSMKSPAMCEVCGRIFQSYALLKDHTWTHTGEKPFKCELCPKTFRMKQRLVAHRRVHSAQRASYVCNVCGKHFSTHSNRQRHMFIHTGLKPYKCEMCGKGFKHASEKRAHVTYVHLKKPWPKRARRRPGDREPHSELEELWPCPQQKAPDDADKAAYYT